MAFCAAAKTIAIEISRVVCKNAFAGVKRYDAVSQIYLPQSNSCFDLIKNHSLNRPQITAETPDNN